MSLRPRPRGQSVLTLPVFVTVGLTSATFDSKHMNWTMLGKFVIAVMAVQMDGFQKLLGTTDLTMAQFGWALPPAVALLLLWEIGKAVARALPASHGR
jgi:P-type Ca2+ transporter type 2C